MMEGCVKRVKEGKRKEENEKRRHKDGGMSSDIKRGKGEDSLGHERRRQVVWREREREGEGARERERE